MTNPASTAQKRKIYALAREQKLDDEQLHDIVGQSTGKLHISSLTMRDAIAVIDRLQGKRTGGESAGYPVPEYNGDRFAAGKATERQLSKILALAQDYGWVDADGRGDAAAVNSWLDKRFGVSMLEWLDKSTAEKAIEGLKVMVDRKIKQKLKND